MDASTIRIRHDRLHKPKHGGQDSRKLLSWNHVHAWPLVSFLVCERREIYTFARISVQQSHNTRKFAKSEEWMSVVRWNMIVTHFRKQASSSGSTGTNWRVVGWLRVDEGTHLACCGQGYSMVRTAAPCEANVGFLAESPNPICLELTPELAPRRRATSALPSRASSELVMHRRTRIAGKALYSSSCHGGRSWTSLPSVSMRSFHDRPWIV